MKNRLSAIVLSSSLVLTSCNQQKDARAERAVKEQPVYEITHSVERDNINKRLALANDPTQIMWVYCLSDMGNVVMSSPVVGKPTSSNKRLEPYVSVVDRDSTDGDSRSWDQIGADRTYGSSDSYVYWFTPEGQYIQWNGLYIASNVPLKIERPIFNTRDIDYTELQRAKLAQEALKEGKKVNNKLEVGEKK